MGRVRLGQPLRGNRLGATPATVRLYWDCVRLLTAIEREQKAKGIRRQALRRGSGRGIGPDSRGVGERVLRRALGNLYKTLYHNIGPRLGLDVAALRRQWDQEEQASGAGEQPSPSREMPDIRRLRPRVDR